MYVDFYSEDIVSKLAKLRKKDLPHYSKVCKKMDSIVKNPEGCGTKFL